MSNFVNLDTGRPFISYVGAERYKEATWITMMARSFKAADVQRNTLSAQGSWMNKTNNIQRYSRVDVYY